MRRDAVSQRWSHYDSMGTIILCRPRRLLLGHIILCTSTRRQRCSWSPCITCFHDVVCPSRAMKLCAIWIQFDVGFAGRTHGAAGRAADRALRPVRSQPRGSAAAAHLRRHRYQGLRLTPRRQHFRLRTAQVWRQRTWRSPLPNRGAERRLAAAQLRTRALGMADKHRALHPSYDHLNNQSTKGVTIRTRPACRMCDGNEHISQTEIGRLTARRQCT